MQEGLLYLFLTKELIAKNICVERTAFSTPPVICELQLLHSESYWSSGMLIHWQNSYAPGSKGHIGHCEVQSHELINLVKILLVSWFQCSFLTPMELCIKILSHCGKHSYNNILHNL
jgi:hypothetical protein